MKRRKFLLGAGSAAAGGSALIGTGAFTSVSAERSVTVNVAGDADAYLRLATCTGSDNGDYVTGASDGAMAIDLSSDNPTDAGGEGVNPEALSVFDNVFEICNQGTQHVCVDFKIDVPEIPGPVPDKYDFEAGDPAVVFYRGSNRDEYISTGQLNVDRPGAISLSIDNGECQCVGFEVRAFGFDTGKDLFEDADMTIRADANGDCKDGTVDPTPGFRQLNNELYIEDIRADDDQPDITDDDVTGEFTRESDKLNLYGKLPDSSDNSDAGYGANVELAVGTVEPVDLADAEKVKIEWDHTSTEDAQNSNQDRSYFGVDSVRSDINRGNAEDGNIERYELNSDTNFSKRVDELDVSGISGSKHIGVGIQVSSNWEQDVELDVFDVYGLDSSGTRVFEFAIPGN